MINIIINNNGPVVWTRKITAHKFTFWGHCVCVSRKKKTEPVENQVSYECTKNHFEISSRKTINTK
jgi:hypothetical protein